MRDMGDIYLNSYDAVLFGTISHLLAQKVKGLQYEIWAATNKFDFGYNRSLVGPTFFIFILIKIIYVVILA